MAFAARLGALTEELIEVIVGQQDPRRVNSWKDTSLRSLRQHNFLRTNQFEVQDALDGFVERFRVVNRDGLADALQERLDILSEKPTKFTPDILHFLLKLSDQPIQKTKLADLQALTGPRVDPGAGLKWENIAQEDGWGADRDVWKKVDFGDSSSEDDPLADETDDASVASEQTSPSSVEAQFHRRPIDLIVPPQGEDSLARIRQSQDWRELLPPRDTQEKAPEFTISELQALRETLFMLQGFDNSLFTPRGEPLATCSLQHASRESFQHLLASLGLGGRRVAVLRSFAKKPQRMPLLQVFRAAVTKRIHVFDAGMATIEKRFVSITDDTAVSLLRLRDDIQPFLGPLVPLSDIVQQLERERHSNPFRYLELLHDAASVAQLECNEVNHLFLGRLFFECFQVYLWPIRKWMEEGELIEDDETFFVADAETQISLSQIWEGRFKLRETADGTLYVPQFLQPAASKIFTTGKSVVVLKRLGKRHPADDQAPEPALDFESLIASDRGRFAPFPEMFRAAFEDWMQSKHHTASATLRHALFDHCGLWSVVAALEEIYLDTDGSRSDAFAFAIFKNLDILNPRWHDRFTLTELAQEAFAGNADPHRITVTVPRDDSRDEMRMARRSVRKCLPFINMSYRMAWPVQIVISEESIAQYQAVSVFSLQLRRANYVLHRSYQQSGHSGHAAKADAVFYGLRSKLLWFCNTLRSYLANLVMAPLTSTLREDLDHAVDVDAMIQVHAAFAKRLRAEACLGSKLGPIYQCMLDIFDLAIRLSDAHKREVGREGAELQDDPQPSAAHAHGKSPGPVGRRGHYKKTSEVEDASFMTEQGRDDNNIDASKGYAEILREIKSSLERHLRFITGGLRGVARASGDGLAAVKWDSLAEMLEAGVQQKKAW